MENCRHVLRDKTVLITGGTGSFGTAFCNEVLSSHLPHKLIIFSRDELKQHEMAQRYKDHKVVRFFLGDVRDKDRLYRAFEEVNIVIHAAALKQVPAAEYNPLEVIKTNVLGSANVIDAAIDRDVQKVVALSTDKAVNPINLYGATKLCADKLFTAAGSYSGPHKTKFSVVRYGNVLGSRGSAVSLFKKYSSTSQPIPITDETMTRFWITIEEAVQFVIESISRMHGGEIFVPKIPSSTVVDLAKAVAPDSPYVITGIRPGEKLHEALISEDEARYTFDCESHYLIQKHALPAGFCHPKVPLGFKYTSNTSRRLTVDELRIVTSTP